MFQKLLCRGVSVLLVTALFAVLASPSAVMGNGLGVVIEFETELTSMQLSGGPFPIPLASDPNNLLGDSVDGYGFVDSAVILTLSSQRAPNPGQASLGGIIAFQPPQSAPPANAQPAAPAVPATIDPDALHGENFRVDSFFDVFFDITVTDVDARPGRDFAGQPDGASLMLLDNGEARISSNYFAIFDKNAHNFGLFPPPEADPLNGFVDLEIPLGGDINGNGENDKVKITFVSLSVGDSSRNLIPLPDGAVLNEFDAASYIDGLVVDESTDPPFRIGAELPSGLPDPSAFGGPTTATSELQNPILPEPATLSVLAIGSLAILRRRRRTVR